MKRLIIDYLLIAVGAFIAALALNLFLSPARLAPGGVSGASVILHSLFGWPIGLLIFVLNVPLFLMGGRLIGREFLIKSIVGTACFSIFAGITSGASPFTDDVLLNSVYGGAMSGVGLALPLSRGGSTGGTDILARLLKRKWQRLKLGNLFIFIDLFVILSAGLLFGSHELALYALFCLIVSSKMINLIVEGGMESKAIYIISSRHELISKAIMLELERGVTGMTAEGMWEKKEVTMLLCVVNVSELTALKRIVGRIDRDAFLILTEAREVLGNGFLPI